MKCDGKMQCACDGNRPRLGKVEQHVPRIIRRWLERQRMTVPVGVGIVEVESATARQTKLDRGERPVAVVAQAINGIDVDDRQRIRGEADFHFLLFDAIAGTKRSGAGSSANGRSHGGEKQENARAIHRRQGVSDCSYRIGLTQKWFVWVSDLPK